VSDQLVQTLRTARALDKRLEEWNRSLPPEFSYTLESFNKSSTPSWLWSLCEGLWVPKFRHGYSSLLTEIKWLDWWNVRLILNQAILQTIHLIDSKGLQGDNLVSQLIPDIKRLEIEHTLITIVDGQLESCISMFTRPLRGKPEVHIVEDVCSLRGYMFIGPLSSVLLCLNQVALTGFETQGRLDWTMRVMSFIETNLGYAKAGAYRTVPNLGEVPLQLWGMQDIDIAE
jgi:hypothetical protein